MATADPARPGFALPLLLLAGFRTLIDDLHAELAREGHPELRPLHGFVLQAVGTDGTTATELGQRLGISKQAAGKTVDRLVALGYLERVDDPADARRRLVRVTPRGADGLRRSAEIFDRLRAQWADDARPGPGRRDGRRPRARWPRPTGSASTCPAGSAADPRAAPAWWSPGSARRASLLRGHDPVASHGPDRRHVAEVAVAGRPVPDAVQPCGCPVRRAVSGCGPARRTPATRPG